MQPQILTVHNIHKAIEDVGIVPYANTIVQEMAGQYYFVDAEEITEEEHSRLEAIRSGVPAIGCVWYPVSADLKPDRKVYFKYMPYKIPIKIAYFIIQALQLKSRMAHLGIPPASDIPEGSMAVYLTPGTEIFGHKVEKLTEIPAELRPVVLERL